MTVWRDDLGSAVELAAPARRVVSLVPSLTEAVAQSAPGRLVGATDWCTHPAGLVVTRVRGTKNPERAAIIALAPDLVIANREENRKLDVVRLRDAGLAVWVTVIESHIDNMTGELLGGFMQRLFSAGALDVSYTPIQMKKNRPAILLTVLCPPELGQQLALSVLQETTTLGVRIQQVRRLKAQRYQETIATSLGPILVKVKRLGSRVISAAPEYEECQRVAQAHDLPLMDVYEVVQAEIHDALSIGSHKL